MTESFRQKLVNWFCSVTHVLFSASLPPLIFWFVDLPTIANSSSSFNLADIAGLFGESMLLYALLIPFFLFWHLFDFAQQQLPDKSIVAKLTNYRTFLFSMMIGIILFLLMILKVFHYNSCDQLDGALYHECIVGPSPWLMVPWMISLIAAMILCLIKSTVSIHSLLKKSQ